MKTYKLDDKIIFDCCEHLKWDEKEKKFNLREYDELFPIGFDKDDIQHILCLCIACGERMERKMFINMIENLQLNIIVSHKTIELKSKNAWRRFLGLFIKDEEKMHL